MTRSEEYVVVLENLLNTPLVSIVVPVFNSESTIQKTLESISNQTLSDYEVIFIDDLSTDDSINLLKNYALINHRVSVLSLTKKGGASIARNVGIKESKGRFIAFLDSDDYWNPNKLEIQLKYMMKNSVFFSYTNYDVVDQEGTFLYRKTAPSKITYKRLLFGNPIGCLTVIYDKTKIGNLRIPRIDKRNDFALWLQALKKVNSGYLCPEVLATYVTSDNSLSRSTSKYKMIKYHYILFNKIENFGIGKSLFYSFANVISYFVFKIKYIKNKE